MIEMQAGKGIDQSVRGKRCRKEGVSSCWGKETPRKEMPRKLMEMPYPFSFIPLSRQVLEEIATPLLHFFFNRNGWEFVY
jgi:hypothetical protein